MSKTFCLWQPGQTRQLPPSSSDWLEADHQVYLLAGSHRRRFLNVIDHGGEAADGLKSRHTKEGISIWEEALGSET